MSYRKLPNPPAGMTLFKSCKSPEHKPPVHVVLEPGTWEWKCQTCGEATIVCVHDTGNWATSDGTRGQFEGAPQRPECPACNDYPSQGPQLEHNTSCDFYEPQGAPEQEPPNGFRYSGGH